MILLPYIFTIIEFSLNGCYIIIYVTLLCNIIKVLYIYFINKKNLVRVDAFGLAPELMEALQNAEGNTKKLHRRTPLARKLILCHQHYHSFIIPPATYHK